MSWFKKKKEPFASWEYNQRIVEALGLGEKRVSRVTIIVDARQPMKVIAETFTDDNQAKQLVGELRSGLFKYEESLE